MAKRIIQEIKHFTDLEHIWWGARTSGGQKRYDIKAQLFKKYCQPKPTDKILEIGCGDGEFTRRIVSLKSSITATDITPAVITRAKKNIHLKNVKFLLKNAENLKFRASSFDIVCGISILHHIDTKKALQESYRVLKKGGSIFFTEPNLLNPLISIGLNIDWLRQKMEFSPGETALLRWQVKKMLTDIGFRAVIVKNHDFLYPLTPRPLIETAKKLSNILEKTPLIKEISGSLIIYAIK